MKPVHKANTSDKWRFPNFDMPSIWNEDDEIYNLMQTFKRPRDIDPSSYDFKINFWTNLIDKYAAHHHMIVLSEPDLQTIFTKEFHSHGLSAKPLCLSTVLRAMESSGKVVPISKFERGSLVRQVVSGIGWLARASLQWSYGAVASVFSSSEHSEPATVESSGALVAVDVVERCLHEFLDWLVARSDSMLVSSHQDLVPRDAFNALLADYFPHPESRALAQNLLISRRLIAIITVPALPSKVSPASPGPSEAIELVRFARSLDAPLPHEMCAPLDLQTADQMRGLVQLRALARRLEADETLLEEKVASAKAAVKETLRTRGLEEAKKHLKRSKVLERVLAQKRAQLQNVETMLMEIETSSDNVQVLRALSGAAGALRARSMELGSVQDTMAELGDALADQEDINASLAAGPADWPAQQAEMAELEQDLAHLLAGDEDDKMAALLDLLPEIPAGPVSPPRRQGDLPAAGTRLSAR